MVERVEVLRGGPSPIYSNGQPGATVNFLLKKGNDTPEGSLRFTGGTGNMRRIDGYYGGKIADKFLAGLAAIRRPSRLLVALLWSVPLWLCIAFGVWAVAVAFRLPMPFTGSFLIMAFLAIGITVPTPGAVGGFHEAFRVAAVEFFRAPHDAAVGAAIVLHAFSIGAALLLGLIIAAQAGMNITAMRDLAREAESGRPA